MKESQPIAIPVKRVLKKLGQDIREARIRRRIPTQLMAERIGVTRATLKSIEDGLPSVSMGFYATAIYVLGRIDRINSLMDIAFDKVGQALDSEHLPKRIVIKKERR